MHGILRSDGKKHWVEGQRGACLWEEGCIWDGYVRHWLNQPVCGRLLQERGYDTDRRLLMLWPGDFDDRLQTPHFQIYLNERLTNFRGSLLGHSAINVRGRAFNFSYRRNENEAVPVEEYLYRPALGQFGVHPVRGRVDGEFNGRPYYNNFGRLFGRTIHVLHVETSEEVAGRLSAFFQTKMDIIRNAPVVQEAPNSNPFFHFYRRNCATIIRDGLRRAGPFPVRGVTPMDLFESALMHFRREANRGTCRVGLWSMRQLKVPEAPYSAMVRGINPLYWARQAMKGRRIRSPQ